MKTSSSLVMAMNVKLVRLFGWFGIISPIFGFAVIFGAISTAPWFSWTGNALSDLGVSGGTSILFNSGLQMTAAVMAVFSLGIYELTKGDRLSRAAFVLSFANAVFLALLAFFPETAGSIHRDMSVSFFLSLPLSQLVMALYMRRRGMFRFSYFMVATAIVSILPWIPRWEAVAIPEAIAALAAGIWMAALGYWMTRVKDEW